MSDHDMEVAWVEAGYSKTFSSLTAKMGLTAVQADAPPHEVRSSAIRKLEEAMRADPQLLRYVEWKAGRGSMYGVVLESLTEATRSAHGLSLIIQNFKGWPLIQGKIEGYQNRFVQQSEDMDRRKTRVEEFLSEWGVAKKKHIFNLFMQEAVMRKEKSDALKLVELLQQRKEVSKRIQRPPRFVARPGQQWAIHKKAPPAGTIPTSRFW